MMRFSGKSRIASVRPKDALCSLRTFARNNGLRRRSVINRERGGGLEERGVVEGGQVGGRANVGEKDRRR